MGGAREAAWPLIRRDLSLSYIQIGSLMGIPAFISSFIEPALGVLSDAWRRRALILAGGAAFAAACMLTAASGGYVALLLAAILFNPASGAFTGLSQTALMDHEPSRRVRNMMLWTLAGSVGAAAGPIALGIAQAAGPGWRGLFVLFGAAAAATLVPAWRSSLLEKKTRRRGSRSSAGAGIRETALGALRALRSGAVLRWLVLLKLSDLMLDILFGMIALYYVDVLGATAAEAALAVTVWTCAGLAGDFLVVPLAERVSGPAYLRVSAAAIGLVFPAFLLAGNPVVRLVLLAMLGLLKAGWYPLLQAGLYASMPGRSGAVLALDNIAGLAASLIPIGLGAVAQAAGLSTAMWLLLAGPAALLVGLPRGARKRGVSRREPGKRASGRRRPAAQAAPSRTGRRPERP